MELCQHIPAARNTEELTRSEDIQDMEKKVKKANIATCKEATQRFGAE